jgi:hypothetical protein
MNYERHKLGPAARSGNGSFKFSKQLPIPSSDLGGSLVKFHISATVVLTVPVNDEAEYFAIHGYVAVYKNQTVGHIASDVFGDQVTGTAAGIVTGITAVYDSSSNLEITVTISASPSVDINSFCMLEVIRRTEQ